MLIGTQGTIVLDKDLAIGRDPSSDLMLDEATVSREHALVRLLEGRWYVEDRGSLNGTSLNGVRLTPGNPVAVRHGDRIAFGGEGFVFSWSESADIPGRTESLPVVGPRIERPLSPVQLQVVRCLCSEWLVDGAADRLPTNDEIAVQLGLPRASGAVKSALRGAYAKAGLTSTSGFDKRLRLCIAARQRGWI